MDPDLRPSLLAGAVAGLAVLGGFAAVHAATIGFFPQIFAEGTLPVLAVGALAGRAYHRLRAQLPRGALGGITLAGLLWVPAMLLTAGARLLAAPVAATLDSFTLAAIATLLSAVAITLAASYAIARRLTSPAIAAAYLAAMAVPTLFFGGNALAGAGLGRGAWLGPGTAAASLLAGALLAVLDARLRAAA
ncbi:MAG TPA: hypothetical protein VGR28_13650 [Candidatus Thermoplasmatota archaeon]|nr:hypothetical protein [Candidatus Thermoplasmatota archaeon]